MTDEEKFEIPLDLAFETIESGGEVSRAEETVRRINGCDTAVFALPTLIIAQKGETAKIRRIHSQSINLSRLARINAKSRCLSGEKNINSRFDAFDSVFGDLICNFGATASFSLFFGGSAADALFSGLIGVIITAANRKKPKLAQFSSNLLDSFVAAVLACLPPLFGIDVHRDKIIIGTIMLLVPGLTVVNAIKDMMNSDLIAGMLELFDAVMSALSIAFGVAGAYCFFPSP